MCVAQHGQPMDRVPGCYQCSRCGAPSRATVVWTWDLTVPVRCLVPGLIAGPPESCTHSAPLRHHLDGNAAHAGVYPELWETPLKLEQVRQVQREARAGGLAPPASERQRPNKRRKPAKSNATVRRSCATARSKQSGAAWSLNMSR